MSLALVIAYLALVLVLVTVMVIFCLGCGCHIHFGRFMRCFCDETRRCCRKKTENRTQPESVADEGPVIAGRRRASDARNDPPCDGCLRAIPWILTCGYCCGEFKDSFTTNRQLAEADGEAKKSKPLVVMGQPVFEDVVDVAETENAVAVSMPLLSVRVV